MNKLKSYPSAQQAQPGQINDTGIRPEKELLLCCARTVIDEGTADRIQILLRQAIDWSYLIDNAVHHRVVPLLYLTLRQSYPGIAPKEILQELEHHYRANVRRNLYLTVELIKLIDWLKTSHQIAVIPYKGPALAMIAYGNLSLRQFGDLDILVHQRDYLTIRDLLLAQGYRLAADWGWECSLVDDTRRVCIDLHRGIAPEEFPTHLSFGCLQEHLEAAPVPGGRINTPCPEDMLIMLCIQLTKDAWEGSLRLSKICDIAELLRARPNLNWEAVFKEARKLGCQRMLFLGLSVAHKLLGAPVPESLSRSRAYPHSSALTAHIYQRLILEAGCSYPTQLSRAHFHFKMRERWRDKIYPYYHRCKVLMTPNERDKALLPLLPFLSFFYYGIRPLRLLRDYGLSVVKILRTKWVTWNRRH